MREGLGITRSEDDDRLESDMAGSGHWDTCLSA